MRETNPEWQQQQQQQQSDAMSEASSASGGNRSSLSWALSRLGNVFPGASNEVNRVYNRTVSNRELASNGANDGAETGTNRRSYHRYGRSSTLENLENASGNQHGGGGRPLSIVSDEDAIITNGGTNKEPPPPASAASYRSFTRTRSREYFSPEGSRGTSPVTIAPVTSPPAAVAPPAATALTINPIVQQLSTVLENGPLGLEGEVANRNSPKVQRKEDPPPVAVGTEELKSRRVSRFLRPDFFDQQQKQQQEQTNGNSSQSEPQNSKERFLKSVEQRWEKINSPPPPQEENKIVTSPPATSVTTVERIIPVMRAAVPALPPVAPGPPSTASLLQARQNLQPIPAPVAVPVTAVPTPPAPQLISNGNNNSSPPKTSTPIAPPPPPVNGNGGSSSNKNSPKLTVRRQFEHLINLAAAQFQRSQSPNKSQPPPQQQQQVQSTSSQNAEAISLELKELEDEIRNTAAIKAQAQAKLEALKYQHALKTGQQAGQSNKPAVPVKPDHLHRSIPPEFLPFQYNGTNGALRDLSSSNGRPMSPPPPAPAVLQNGNRAPQPFGFDDESVRFARIKRVEPPSQSQPDSADIDGMATPTDSYESSSVCSDLRGDLRGERGLGADSDDESVSERIFRKSFYTRFNEPGGKMKLQQQLQRRSFTNKDLLNLTNNSTSTTTAAGTTPSVVNDCNSNLIGGNGTTQPSPSSERHRRRSSHHRNSRDESAEAVMVRKFISSTAASCAEPVHYLLDKERRSLTRTDPDSEQQNKLLPTSSREPSIARSVDVQSPVPGEAQQQQQQQPRSYSRTYQSSVAAPTLPPLPPTSPESQYSSASLGRRSYYSTAAAGDHYGGSGSLPRRSTNRYSKC